MLLTHFSFYRAPVTSSYRPPEKEVTLEEVYNYLIGPEAKGNINALRHLPTKKQKDEFKKNHLDFCTFSGIFGDSRKSDCMIRHSGLLMLDIDDLTIHPDEAKKKLLQDTKFTPLLMFTSPKGNGLKVATQIDVDKASMEQYVEAFHIYLEQEYGFLVDTHCKDVARACFLSWDPAAILNRVDNPAILNPYDYIKIPPSNTHHTVTPVFDTKNHVERVIREITDRGISIAQSYDSYLKIGFAFANCFGEEGRSYYHQVCQFDSKYVFSEAEKQYTNCLKSTKGGITIATFFALAKEHGIDISISNPSSVDGHDTKNKPEPVLPTFSNKVRDLLPEFGQKIIARFENPKDADVMLLGWLAIMSSTLPRISGKYDEKVVFPHIYVYVEGMPASGKGHLSLLRQLIVPIEEGANRDYSLAMTNYYLEHQKWEESGCQTDEPKEPLRRILCIPADSTAAAFISQLHENGGDALVFETEADTLVHALSSPYGHYSEIFRKAYHHEMISKIRKQNKEYTCIAEPKIAVCLTGTPDQTSSLVKGIEDGLTSRFIFYHLPENISWRNPFLHSDIESLNVYYNNLGIQYYEKYYQQYFLWEKTQFKFTEKQQDLFNTKFTKLLSDSINDIGNEIISTVFRLGLITFRVAMILSVLRAVENQIQLGGVVFCDDRSFEAAMEISKVVLEHDIYVVSSMPKNRTQFTEAKIMSFYDALPTRFNRQEYHNTAKSLGFNPRTVDAWVRTLWHRGLLTKNDNNNYSK